MKRVSVDALARGLVRDHSSRRGGRSDIFESLMCLQRREVYIYTWSLCAGRQPRLHVAGLVRVPVSADAIMHSCSSNTRTVRVSLKHSILRLQLILS